MSPEVAASTLVMRAAVLACMGHGDGRAPRRGHPSSPRMNSPSDEENDPHHVSNDWSQPLRDTAAR